MNDLESTDGGHGSGDTSSGLKKLAKDLQRAATDNTIESKQTETTFYFILDDSSGMDITGAKRRPDGTYENGLQGETFIYVPRDSQAWKDVHDSYQPIIDNLVMCGELKYDDLALPLTYMDYVCQALNQGDSKALKELGESIQKGSNKVSDGDIASIKKELTSGNGTWSVADKMGSTLEPWKGRAANVFKVTYMDRLPDILVGQAVLAIALREALNIAKEAFRGAKEDGENLAQAAIDALDAGGASLDATYSEKLKVIANVAGIAAAVTAFAPGTQAFSAVAGLVAASAGAAEYVISKYEKTSGGTDPKIALDAGNVEELMDQVNSRANDIQKAVVDIEYATGEMLYELYLLATSKEVVDIAGASGENAGDLGIELTMRQAYFEPRSPGKESGHGPGMRDFGKQLDDKDKGNDPGYSDFKDEDAMGAIDKGEHMATSIYDLWHAGDTTLPAFAAEYDGAAGDVDSSTTGLSDAFTRPFGGGDDGAGSSTGVLYPEWTRLQEELHTILKNSATNLHLVGKALVAAAIAYAEADGAAAKAIEKDHEDFPKI
ncbi:hypothetical protein [Stackebrandtia nassauensis]|uniref:Uncharacterized protein n=1 Tax=Stackebrandtia nassauensis (strain DSM 44728 / CIP 108903 / NRRL B-16338 / NBRC 102104 / LLR-40K-21) TaxID=446470 RepID=D3Q7T8_STANL|nr:hypothetical protein [Stackebrandtia nassauensis]ADD44430.1 hypothetical protein Snas_4789 [Stackebrandtia nassauensis DSM 44728]